MKDQQPVQDKNNFIQTAFGTFEGMFKSMMEYADKHNFFGQMETDNEFQKSYQQFENNTKHLSDLEKIQAQLINVMLDDFHTFQGDGEYSYYDEELSGVSLDLLRQAGKCEAAMLIKNHRRLQLDAFGRLPKKDQQGVKLAHKDEDYKPSNKENDEMKKWSDILANKFFYMPGEYRPSLGKVMGAAYSDFFDFDKICFQIVRALDGSPLNMTIIDPALVKHIVPQQQTFTQRWDQNEYDELLEQTNFKTEFYKDDYRYMLFNKHKTRQAKFTHKTMIVSHFYKSSDSYSLYKGFSIVEQAVNIITNIINSISMNASRMTNTRAPQGMIALQGGANVNQILVEKFKKLLWAQTSGATNRYKIPIISLPEKNQIQYVPFHQNSKDMEFFNWMSLMFTILCRLSGTDPEELSLASNRGAIEGKGSLFQQGQEGMNRRSRDNGLRTFLTYFCEVVNDSGIIADLTGHEDWVLIASGLDVKDELQKEELNSKKLNTHASINQILTDEGKKEFELMFDIGNDEKINAYDIPGIQNQNVYQLFVMAVQNAQQEAMMQQQQAMGMQGENGTVHESENESNEQLPDFSEEDLKILQEYGVKADDEKDKQAIEKAYNHLKDKTFFAKSMRKMKNMHEQRMKLAQMNKAIEIVLD